MSAKVKQVFEATDGETFPTKAAAERHSALVVASRLLEKACQAVNRAMGEKALTADGQPFNMNVGDYWRVTPSWAGTPQLQELTLYARNMSVDVERGRLVVREYDHKRKEYITFDIGELYADESEARKALNAAIVERIEELQSQLTPSPAPETPRT